jgi:hypothetical protein
MPTRSETSPRAVWGVFAVRMSSLFCDLDEVSADQLGDELSVLVGERAQEVWIVGEGRAEGWLRGRVEAAMDAVIAAVAVDWAHHRPGGGGHVVVMVVVTAVAAIIVGMAASAAFQSEQTPALVCERSGICRRLGYRLVGQ